MFETWNEIMFSLMVVFAVLQKMFKLSDAKCYPALQTVGFESEEQVWRHPFKDGCLSKCRPPSETVEHGSRDLSFFYMQKI